MNSSQKTRTRIVFGFLVMASLGLISALYWRQIVQGQEFMAKADKQYIKPKISLFDRGSIYMTSKDGSHIAAASVSNGYIIFMNPSQLVDVSGAYQALSQYIDLDHQDFLKKSEKKTDQYKELAEHVAEDTANSISALGVKGIGVQKQSWRSYPGGSLASQTLGIIGENKDSSVEGRYGLERSYESTLTRKGTSNSANVFAQIFAGFSDGSGDTKAGDLNTTLEPTVQKFLERSLGQISNTWKSDEIGGIIMDPNTGEIVAMASLPTYDPNDLSGLKNTAVLSNPLVEHVYEMGSIIKPLTMSVGLDTGAINVNSTYEDTGTMELSGKKISNYDGKARGKTDMQQILSQSLNVGVATISLLVGKQDFAKYFGDFGFGDKTGVDEPNEATGIVNNLKTGRDVEIATASYGQGVAFSPMATVRGLAILANGGYLVTPHIVKEIAYEDGTMKSIPVTKTGPVLKKQTVDDVTGMLVKVVDDALLKGEIKNAHYKVAAKTGTAQIADHVNGGYYSDKYLHSFFGYFPATKPQYIVFLYQINPKGAEYASATLTKPFDEITKFLINYYDIPPDR